MNNIIKKDFIIQQWHKSNEYNIFIYDENDCFIERISIDTSYKENETWYYIKERDQHIDDLIQRIAEIESESNKFLMKEDLKTLVNLKDDFIFLSESTNEFISKTDDKEEYNNLCEQFITNFKSNE